MSKHEIGQSFANGNSTQGNKQAAPMTLAAVRQELKA